MVIKILDHVTRATDYGNGEVIFRQIRKAFDRGEKVTVSFAGVVAAPSAFINAAFVQLLEHYSIEFIHSHLAIIDSTRQINAVIKRRFAFVEATERELA